MGTATDSVGQRTVEEVLAHFGVRGMKWGVRRSKAELASAGSKTPAADDAIQAVASASKVKSAGSLNVLSTKELQQLVDRMNLEQRYVNLTTDTSKQQKGEGLAKKILKNESESILLKGRPGPVATGIEALLTKGAGKHKK